jgi:hypothetical protein
VVEARRVIRASPEHIFAYLARVEHLPRYGSPLWMTAESVEKRGATQVVALSGYFAGLPIESIQRVALRAPTSLEVSQVRGTLRAFVGHCTLQGGEDGTEVLYRIEVDPGIPMVTEDSARQSLVQYLGRLLDKIKLAAERKTPVRRGPARAAAGSGASVPAEAGDLEPEPDEEPVPLAEQKDSLATVPASEAVPGADEQPVQAAAAPRSHEAVHPRQPAPAGRPVRMGESRPGPAGAPTGRHRRRRRRRRRHGGGGPGTPGGAPHPPA